MTSTPNRRQVKVGEDALSFRMKDENRRYLTLQPTAPPDLIKLMAARGVVFSQARPSPHPGPPGPRRTALPTQSAPVRRRSIARKRRCAPVMRSSRSPTTEMPAWSATNVPAWFLVFEVCY